jgi:transcriptional regulator with XRE-family HTH domain
MPKSTYTPTETDRATGENVRRFRKQAGETLAETVERARLDMSIQTLSRIERGERYLPAYHATKLAAHFNTTPDRIIIKPVMDVHPSGRIPYKTGEYPTAVSTEQEWLGNPEPEKPALFAVTDRAAQIETELAAASGNWITINQDAPLTPEQYREQVWIPYLEARYSADLKAS